MSMIAEEVTCDAAASAMPESNYNAPGVERKTYYDRYFTDMPF